MPEQTSTGSRDFPVMLSVSQACQILGISQANMHTWIGQKEFPCIQRRYHKLIPGGAITHMIEQRGVIPAGQSMIPVSVTRPRLRPGIAAAMNPPGNSGLGDTGR